MKRTNALITLSALHLAVVGCKVSASASGEAKSGDIDSAFDASAESSTPDPVALAPHEPARSIEYRAGKLEYSGVINFEYDKAELRSDPETKKTLADFVTFLKQHPDVELQIEGHTDSRGSDNYNRDLSERRARALRTWLIAQGVAEGRLTSVGKGESEPQTPEPDACENKHPANSAPCEAAWAKNRRVVFSVTEGAEELEQARAASPPSPPPSPALTGSTAREACPWLIGPRLNALGPNSWAMVEGAVQPGICWLELSLGVGLGLGDRDASNEGADVDGGYWSLSMPFRGRFWFMARHSLIGDAGIGFTHYDISGDAQANGTELEYDRSSTPLIAHLGLGYGFRPNGSQAGFRFGAIAGALFHLSDLSDSSINGGFPAPLGAALQAEMDNESDDLTDVEPYGEVSFSWLF